MQGNVNCKGVNYNSSPLIGVSAIPGSCMVLGIDRKPLEDGIADSNPSEVMNILLCLLCG
jgi:hypothetical protein